MGTKGGLRKSSKSPFWFLLPHSQVQYMDIVSEKFEGEKISNKRTRLRLQNTLLDIEIQVKFPYT